MGNQTKTQQVCNAGRLPRASIFSGSARRSAESYERQLIQYRSMEIRLRDTREALRRQRDELIQKQEFLSRESDRRLLKDLRTTVRLLSL